MRNDSVCIDKKWTLPSWSLLFIVMFGICLILLFNRPIFASLGIRQSHLDSLIPIDDLNPVVQTFANLNSEKVEIYPQTSEPLQALKYSLQAHIQAQNSGNIVVINCSTLWIILTRKCELSGLKDAGPESNPVTITLTSHSPQGIFSVWASLDDAYPDADLFIAGKKQSGDLAFSSYQPFPLLERWKPILINSVYLLGISLLYWVLGTGLFHLVMGRDGGNRLEEIVLGLFTGITATVIFLASLNIFQVPLLIASGLFLVLSTGLSIVYLLSNISHQSFFTLRLSIQPDEILLVSTFLVVIIISSFQMTSVISPLWVDGLNHQVLLENIIEAQNLFVDPTYPTGFHAIAYVNHIVWGLSVPDSILLTGQWFNTISGLSFFLLARKIYPSNYLTWISTALYWFVAPFPDYFLNWSRFPFTMGFAFLPLGIFGVKLWCQKSRFWVLIGAWSLMLALTHYGAFTLPLKGTYVLCRKGTLLLCANNKL
jgi:hypothetical protein